MSDANGSFGGALKESRPPISVPSSCSGMNRAAVDPAQVGMCSWMLLQAGAGMNVARQGREGPSVDTPEETVNRVCGSGLQRSFTPLKPSASAHGSGNCRRD